MGRWAGRKPDDDYKAAVEPRFVQWVVDTFQLSIKRARLSERNCLTTYPGEEKHDRCSRVDSSSVAALFPERLSGLVAAGRLCYCRLPNQDAYELASMRVVDFERSIIQIGPRSAFMRIASAGTTHRAHQSTRNGCRRPMRR